MKNFQFKNKIPVFTSLLNIGHFNSTSVKPRRRGFTLIELLLVISILSILMGFLFASMRAVRRYSREVSTRTEIANLEAAFRQYYDHYGHWPVEDIGNNNDEIEINQDMVDVLSGKPGYDLNPDQIPFFEIFRIKNGRAVNAWGEENGYYRVQFDFEGNNTIPVENVSDTIQRSVVVWTLHPERTSNNNTEFDKRILGSWQQ